MKTKLNQFVPNTKTTLREKYLEKHSKLHKVSSKLYRKYCSITGPLHILPDYYILGVVKGGTTSLYNYLIEHPDIQPSVGKEIDYFGELYYRGLNWYKACFPLQFHKTIVEKLQKKKFLTGEATPRYIEHPFVPERIKKVTPNAKFIILLRNPIDRAYSHWNMNFRRKDDTLTFDQAIQQEEKRIEGEYEKMKNDFKYFNWTYYSYAYKEHGKYIEKLERWIKIFPKERFLILRSEELFEDPAKAFHKTIEFLGLEKWDLKQYIAYKKRKYEKPKMDINVRNQLSEFFKPYNEKLYQFLGKDFGWD